MPPSGSCPRPQAARRASGDGNQQEGKERQSAGYEQVAQRDVVLAYAALVCLKAEAEQQEVGAGTGEMLPEACGQGIGGAVAARQP